jgi:hypothetical protein
MNDIRRTILWVIFGFSMVLLWDKWQIHNGKSPPSSHRRRRSARLLRPMSSLLTSACPSPPLPLLPAMCPVLPMPRLSPQQP